MPGRQITVLLTLILLLLQMTSALQAEDEDNCLPWFVPDNNSSSGCLCNKHLKGIFRCEQESLSVFMHLGNCIGEDNSSDSIVIGQCPYLDHPNIVDRVYMKLPNNISELNNALCGPLNREGLLCAECKGGYGPAAYSYSLQCESCKDNHYGWAVYLLLEIIPATLFFIIVMVFEIRLTAAPMATFVFYSQIVVNTLAYSILSTALKQDFNKFTSLLYKVVITSYGILNLDFLRQVIPPFCVGKNVKNIHLLMLDYIAAFYPLCLVLITYAIIQLHDYKLRPLAWIWKPFHMCLRPFKRTLDVRASIIHTFATFLLLSYSKIVYVSFQLLHGTHLYNVNREKVGHLVFYFDPSVKFFSREHLAFAIPSMLIMLLFVVLPPLLLILYPTRVFRRCFGYCGVRKWHALRVFVETFQWCYKDGTEGTRDYRSLSGLYLVLRIIYCLETTIGTLAVGNGANSWIYSAVLFLTMSLFFALARPYKGKYMNIADSLLLAILVISSFLCLPYLYMANPAFPLLPEALIILNCIPIIVLILYCTYKLCIRRRTFESAKLKLHSCCKLWPHERATDYEFNPDSLPYRFLNPEHEEEAALVTDQKLDCDRCDSYDSNACNEVTRSVRTYGSV